MTSGDFIEFLHSQLLAVADRPLPQDEVAAVLDRFVKPIGPFEKYPDVEPALRHLAARSIPFAVVSALPDDAARPFLHRVGIDESRLPDAPSDALPPPDRGAFKRALAFLGARRGRRRSSGTSIGATPAPRRAPDSRSILLDREDRVPPAAGRRIASLAELPAALSEGPAHEEPVADSPDGP